MFKALLQKKSESENIGKSVGKVDIINSNDLSNDYYAAQYFLEIFDFMYCNEDLRIFKHPATLVLSQRINCNTERDSSYRIKRPTISFWRKMYRATKNNSIDTTITGRTGLS